MAADAEATLPALTEACKRLITADRRRVFDERGKKLGEANANAHEREEWKEDLACMLDDVWIARHVAKLEVKLQITIEERPANYGAMRVPSLRVPRDAQTVPIEAIGVEAMDMSPDMAEKLGYKESTGAYITATSPDGIGADSGLVRGMVVTRVDKKGKGDVVAERFEGKRFNAPNDIVVRRDGHVWFTDPAFGNQQDRRELDFYGVFHVTPKGEIEAVARLKTRPNGIALGPAGKVLYVADSDARAVRAWDVDKNGAASNARVLVEKIAGVPDGLRTDEKGNLYVAAKNVFIYSPQGEYIRAVELGEAPTNLCFGDADLETLFITAHTSVYRVRIGVKGAQY